MISNIPKILLLLLPVLFLSQTSFAGASEARTKEIPVCGSNGCVVHSDPQGEGASKATTLAQAEYFLGNLFNTSNWPARWHCGTWTTFHGWVYILSDIGIWAAYFAIPLVLAFFLYKRKDSGIPFPGVMMLFIAFIFSCGLTHLVDAIIFWEPIYNFSAFIRFITAVVSIGTVFALVKITPEVMEFKSPAELEQIIHERTQEVQMTNEELAATNEELSSASEELSAANEKLRSVNDELSVRNKELAHQIKEKEKVRQELNLVLESIPQIAWTTDESGNITYINEQWWNYSASAKENVIPEWDQIFNSKDIKAIRQKWQKSKAEGTEFMAEGRIRSKTGAFEWFLIKAVPVKNDQDKIQKWIGTFTNIHEQKLNEQRKDTFMNIASHELKTPLTIISAYSELLSNHPQIYENEELRTYASKVDKHIVKLENLIKELLDVSRIGTGKMNYDMQKHDFDEIIKECIQDFQNINKTSHKLVLQGETNVELICDRDKINQVMHNLLGNAIKYSPENKDITIRLSKDEYMAHCSIKDMGMGIPPEEIRNIFKRFYRPSTNKIAGGLGLGLFISDEIIKHHKGRIKAESIEGETSVFTFSLPYIK